ncbi:putative odorant receptor 85d [Lucilia cuprina]|uniref:Odorant receptor n=1 Tax=Lucilia cuprina TaxID=7375 RepID=A0A0L0C1Q1_LUCCU|nr:putative odorant receptor 85d [Lucilia cuprina]
METKGKFQKLLAVKSPKKKLNIRDFYITPFRFYTFVGVKLFHWDEFDIMTKWQKFVLTVTIANLIFSFTWKIFFLMVDEFESTVQMTEWFLYISFAANGFIKTLSVVWGRKILDRVLKTLGRLFPRNAKECEDFKLTEGYNFIHYHSRIMVYSHWTIAFMFMLFPLVQSGVEFIHTRVYVQRLPYILAYPFDTSPKPVYIFCYVTQFMAGFVLSCYFLGSDTLLLHTVYMVVLNFEYLCFRIVHFEPKNFEQDMAEIKDVLEKHYLLNDLAQAVNNVFSLSILMNYMISIMVIVLIGVQIITGSELFDFIKFGGFFASATIQVYYVCLMSTLLMERSASVGDSLMGQKWYMADVRYQRMLTLAIARSQRPAHLTAFKFFMISMESFSNLMTTAYQFFTLLQSRMEEGGL